MINIFHHGWVEKPGGRGYEFTAYLIMDTVFASWFRSWLRLSNAKWKRNPVKCVLHMQIVANRNMHLLRQSNSGGNLANNKKPFLDSDVLSI